MYNSDKGPYLAQYDIWNIYFPGSAYFVFLLWNSSDQWNQGYGELILNGYIFRGSNSQAP